MPFSLSSPPIIQTPQDTPQEKSPPPNNSQNLTLHINTPIYPSETHPSVQHNVDDTTPSEINVTPPTSPTPNSNTSGERITFSGIGAILKPTPTPEIPPPKTIPTGTTHKHFLRSAASCSGESSSDSSNAPVDVESASD